MGDEIDDIGLPIHHQSGEVDIGHESTQTTSIQQEQAGLLNTAIQSYYDRRVSGRQLQENLQTLGYSQQQIDDISSAVQTESTLRQAHPQQFGRTGSDLSINQLRFLDAQNIDYRTVNILRGEGNRAYIDRGGGVRQYLPEAQTFDPLTEQQRTEADERDQILRDITVQEGASGDIVDKFTDDQRQQISDITTRYFNSQGTTGDLMIFRNNIQQIDGIENINNIDEILFQFFLDVDFEAEYRQEHNGLSQLITQEQFDFMRNNQNQYNFTGQAIFETPEGVKYIYGGRGIGKVPIPTVEFIERLNSIPTYSNQYDVRLTDDNLIELDNYTSAYLQDNISRQTLLDGVISTSQYDPDDPTSDPFRADAYNIAQRVADLAIEEKNFRDINNGRPSQLSPLQYEFLVNHDLQEGEPQYNQGLIGINQQDIRFFYIPNSRDTMLIPTDEQIQGFIDSGYYTPPQEQDLGNNQPSVAGLGEPHLAPPTIDPTVDPVSLDPPPLPRLIQPVEPPSNIYSDLGREIPPLKIDDEDNIQDLIDAVEENLEEQPPLESILEDVKEIEEDIEETAQPYGRTVAQFLGAGFGLTTTGERLREVGGMPYPEFMERRATTQEAYRERNLLRDQLQTEQTEIENLRSEADNLQQTIEGLEQELQGLPKPPRGRPIAGGQGMYARYYTVKQLIERNTRDLKTYTNPRTGTIHNLQEQINTNLENIRRMDKRFRLGENPQYYQNREQQLTTQRRQELSRIITDLESQVARTPQEQQDLRDYRQELLQLPRVGLGRIEVADPEDRFATGQTFEERIVDRLGFIEDTIQLMDLGKKALDLTARAGGGAYLGGKIYDSGIPTAIYDTAGLYFGYGEKVNIEGESGLTYNKPEFDLTGYKMNKPPEKEIPNNNPLTKGYIDLRPVETIPLNIEERPIQKDIQPIQQEVGYLKLDLDLDEQPNIEDIEDEFIVSDVLEDFDTIKNKDSVFIDTDKEKQDLENIRIRDPQKRYIQPYNRLEDEDILKVSNIYEDYNTIKNKDSVFIDTDKEKQDLENIRIRDPQKKYIQPYDRLEDEDILKVSNIYENYDIIKNIDSVFIDVDNKEELQNIQQKPQIPTTKEPDSEKWDIDTIFSCDVDDCPKFIKVLKHQYEEQEIKENFKPIYNNTNGKKQTNLEELIYNYSDKITAQNMSNKGYLLNKNHNKKRDYDLGSNLWKVDILV
tara:strand:+ start:258 stop:3857 length:3600 start_codon:yes stop_codon:yes gene_type:complete